MANGGTSRDRVGCQERIRSLPNWEVQAHAVFQRQTGSGFAAGTVCLPQCPVTVFAEEKCRGRDQHRAERCGERRDGWRNGASEVARNCSAGFR